MASLLSGQTALSWPTFVTVYPLVISGKLRALAVTSPGRNPRLPDVPTMKEALPPGFELNAWFGLMGPSGIPVAIVNRINAEVGKILNDPAIRERIEADGTVVFTSTPEEFATLVKGDAARWAAVVKQFGIRVD